MAAQQFDDSDDGESEIEIDDDVCYKHVDCVDPYCYRLGVVLQTEHEEFESDLEVLRDEVVRLTSDVVVTDILASLPASFYARKTDQSHV